MQPDRLSSRFTARASDWLSEHAPQRPVGAARLRDHVGDETSESPAPLESIDELEGTAPMLMMVGGSTEPRSTVGRAGQPAQSDASSEARWITDRVDHDRSSSSFLPLHGPTQMLLEGPEITCRAVTRYDHNLLRAIFVECRSTGLTTLPVALAGALLDMQYRAHRADRLEHWPTAANEIIQVRGVPAGILSVVANRQEIRIVDLDIMMGFRRKGVGAHVLETIQQSAVRQCLPLRITVATVNKTALALCVRCGFLATGETATDVDLEWRP